jgi:hypothetical protein
MWQITSSEINNSKMKTNIIKDHRKYCTKEERLNPTIM